MKQLCLQFLFKPELLHHHIQIWIVSGAWSHLPGPQSCLYYGEAGQWGSVAGEQHIQSLTFLHPFTWRSSMKTLLPRNEQLTLAMLHMRILCALKRLMLLIMALLKRSSWGHYQSLNAYFTKSVYLLSLKLVCSDYDVCLCTQSSVLSWMHVAWVCITVFFAFVCMCSITVHTYLLELATFTSCCLPVSVTLHWTGDLDLQHSRNDRRGHDTFCGMSSPTLVGAVWLCGQGSMLSGDVGWMWLHLLTGKFQLSRTQVVSYRVCVSLHHAQRDLLRYEVE